MLIISLVQTVRRRYHTDKTRRPWCSRGRNRENIDGKKEKHTADTKGGQMLLDVINKLTINKFKFMYNIRTDDLFKSDRIESRRHNIAHAQETGNLPVGL